MASKSAIFLSFTILLSFSVMALSDDPECVYSMYVKTGGILKAGTDSMITATMYSAKGDGIRIKNLVKWGGVMGADYGYLERNNLDIFTGKGPCLTAPVCYLNLTSSGAGAHHGWYCDYVEVTTTGLHRTSCDHAHFDVYQWLALDAPPYQLTAIIDNCPKTYTDTATGSRRDLVRAVPQAAVPLNLKQVV